MTSPSQAPLLSRLARRLFSLRKSSFLICSSLLAGPALAQQAPNVNVSVIGTGTTGAVVTTMPAVAGYRNWLCGWEISGAGSGTTNPQTITGVLGGTQTFYSTFSAGGAPDKHTFQPCVPASGQGVAIVHTTTADGTATNIETHMWGYTSP